MEDQIKDELENAEVVAEETDAAEADVDTNDDNLEEGTADGVVKQEVPDEERLDTVDAAEKAVKSKAPVPGGEANKGDQTPPKTKAGMINAMYQKASGMKKDKLFAAYGKMMAAMESAELGEEIIAEEAEETAVNVTIDVSTEMAALAESEATLSEGFKEKAAVVLEAAVNQKVNAAVKEITAELTEEKEAEMTALSEDMVEKIDGFMNYVVERYMEENKLAIEAGVRTEIAESFMEGMKNLFVENYVEVPEDKVDVVEELEEKVSDLETRLTESMQTSISAAAELEGYKRNAVIAEASVNLAATEVEKLEALAEGIEFDDEESFASKVEILVDTHFSSNTVNESVEADDSEEEEMETVSPSMERYLSFMGRPQ